MRLSELAGSEEDSSYSLRLPVDISGLAVLFFLLSRYCRMLGPFSVSQCHLTGGLKHSQIFDVTPRITDVAAALTIHTELSSTQ